jgi:hypothetical protein
MIAAGRRPLKSPSSKSTTSNTCAVGALRASGPVLAPLTSRLKDDGQPRDSVYATHSAFVQAFRPAVSASSRRPYGVFRWRSSRHAVIRPLESRSRISASFG